MNKVTFGFIVGGDDIYYKNLMRACESLERVKQPHEILIIDMDSNHIYGRKDMNCISI